MQTMPEWLREHGLEQYTDAFRDADVDLDILSDLTDEDLRELGMSLGQRRRFITAARGLAVPAAGPEAIGTGAERRQLTVLFADMVGSTTLSTLMDPEDLLDLVSAYHKICREAVERHGGTVVNLIGDGMLAFFGYPVAAENDAERAIEAGLRIVQDVAQISTPAGAPLETRCGVASGLTVVGNLRGSEVDGYGEIPNLAARIQSVAAPRQVAISDETKAIAGHAFDCGELGLLSLKGFSGRLRVWAAERRDRTESRFMALHGGGVGRLTGRAAELGWLEAAHARAEAGEGAVVAVLGDAGMGKSRLVYELSERAAARGRVITLQGVAGAEVAPFAPAIAELEAAAGITEGDPAEARLDRLDEHCAEFGLSREDASLMAALCGIAPDGRYPQLTLSPARLRASIISALLRRLKAMAERAPLLVVLEDAHWFDPSTNELAAGLATAVKGRRICLVVTVRSSESTPLNTPEGAARIDLGRLSAQDARALLAETVPDLPDETVARVLDRADGVPLFLREIALAAQASSRGDAKAHDPIPLTLQSALLARLDRLGPARRVARAAAVVGREFDAALLEPLLSESRGMIDAVLERLYAEGVIVPVEEGRYRFAHALIHEAAYESQLRRLRREAHLTVAKALGEGAEPRVLAHHLEAGGAMDEAMANWRAAGLKALMASANAEAVTAYGRALALLEAEPDASRDRLFELHVLIEQGLACIALMGFAAPQVGAVYDRAEAIARALEPGLDTMRALWGAWLYALVAGDLARARGLAREMLQIATALGDDSMRCEALVALAITEFWMCDLGDAEAHLDEAVAIYDRLGTDAFGTHLVLFGQDPKVVALCYYGYLYWVIGAPKRSRRASVAAIRHADALGHPFTIAWAYGFAANAYWWRGEHRASVLVGDSGIDYSERQVFPLWSEAAKIGRWASAAAMADGEARTAAARSAVEGLQGYMATGALTVVPTACLQAASACRLAGDLDAARHWIDEGERLAAQTGERVSGLRVAVHRARLMRDADAPDSRTEAVLRAGLADAAGQGAVMIALECAEELADLLACSGRRGEARTILEDALDRMPQPHQHRQIRRAKAYLDALG